MRSRDLEGLRILHRSQFEQGDVQVDVENAGARRAGKPRSQVAAFKRHRADGGRTDFRPLARGFRGVHILEEVRVQVICAHSRLAIGSIIFSQTMYGIANYQFPCSGHV